MTFGNYCGRRPWRRGQARGVAHAEESPSHPPQKNGTQSCGSKWKILWGLVLGPTLMILQGIKQGHAQQISFKSGTAHDLTNLCNFRCCTRRRIHLNATGRLALKTVVGGWGEGGINTNRFANGYIRFYTLWVCFVELYLQTMGLEGYPEKWK